MEPSPESALRLFVKRLAVRSTLSEEDESAIMRIKGSMTSVAAHADLIKQGTPVDHSCLVVEGLVGRFGQNADSTRQITCLHIPGDMGDLPSVVSPKAGWGLAALTRTTILRVPHEQLRRIAAEHPAIAEAFWRDCVADSSIFSEWVVNVGRRSAFVRIAHLFCEMAIRYQQAEQGDRCSYDLPITQADLADATGLTSVHVSRVLKELRTRALVTAQGGRVTIPDWDALVAVADFDESFLLLDKQAPRVFKAA
jgi:CRP-like cAMP-binding protein